MALLSSLRVSTRDAVTRGSERAAGGKSHSSETPTSCSPRPSSNTISVALGSKEQMRTMRGYRAQSGVPSSERAMSRYLVRGHGPMGHGQRSATTEVAGPIGSDRSSHVHLLEIACPL